jgi:hypothetical protein
MRLNMQLPILSGRLWAAHTVQRAKMASVVTIIIELCTHNMNNMTRKSMQFASVPHNKTVTKSLKMSIPEKSTLLVNWLTGISTHVP